MSLHFGWYSFPILLRVGGWVGLGGWLHTKTICQQTVMNVLNPSIYFIFINLFAFAVWHHGRCFKQFSHFSWYYKTDMAYL